MISKRKIFNWLDVNITSGIKMAALFAGLIGIILLIYDFRFIYLFANRWDYINNIIIETHGLIFDLIVLGIIIAKYQEKKEQKKSIERLHTEIDNYREWKEPEAVYKIIAIVNQLIKLGAAKNINLWKCNLYKANLWKVTLEQPSFENANLIDANLMGAVLREPNFSNANMMGAKLRVANIKDGVFCYTNLANADMANVLMQDANFFEAILSNAFLRKANLAGACLRGVNLIDANLQEANLQGVDLVGALVGLDWFEKIKTWNIKGSEEIMNHYRIDERGKITYA